MDILDDLNIRATEYCRSGLGIDQAIQQAVTDYVGQLKGVGYKILSIEEIQQNNRTRFFESLSSTMEQRWFTQPTK